MAMVEVVGSSNCPRGAGNGAGVIDTAAIDTDRATFKWGVALSCCTIVETLRMPEKFEKESSVA